MRQSRRTKVSALIQWLLLLTVAAECSEGGPLPSAQRARTLRALWRGPR